jgi:excisionase family DNA binding protein
MPTYLSLEQVAERLATPKETVRYWVNSGKLAGFKPGRHILVRESDLTALVERSALQHLRAERARPRRKAKRQAARAARKMRRART